MKPTLIKSQILVLILVITWISLFSLEAKALSKFSYPSEILISSPNTSPIKNIESYKRGIIYSNDENLYYDNKLVSLNHQPMNDDGRLEIFDIHSDKNDFYLSTSEGVYKNYKRIFSKEKSSQTLVSKDKIYICTESGIYFAKRNDESEFLLDYKWQLMPSSPREIIFASLNKSKSNLEFVASRNGFYYFSPKKKRWINRSSNLARAEDGLFRFGRFLVTKISGNKTVILPSSTGILVSEDLGKSWKKAKQGIKNDPDGNYNLREIVKLEDHLYLASSTGLYKSSLKNINWSPVKIHGVAKNENFSDDFYSIEKSSKEKLLLLGDSRGNIHKVSLEEVKVQELGIKKYPEAESYRAMPLLASTEDKELDYEELDYDDLGKARKARQIKGNKALKKKLSLALAKEPDIRNLHKAALKFAGIPTGGKFNSYKLQARVRNFLPRFEAFMDAEDMDRVSLENSGSEGFNAGTSNFNSSFDTENQSINDSGTNAGIRFSWNLSNIIYDPEINDLNTNARITANIRENILTELTQIYFARKKALIDFLTDEFLDKHGLPQADLYIKELQLEEYTAQLDARTGGWFSNQIERDYHAKG